MSKPFQRRWSGTASTRNAGMYWLEMRALCRSGPVDCCRMGMAVLKSWRRTGVGSAILAKLIGLAQTRGDRVLILNAQSYVTAFYRRAGFEVTSAEFTEAGIPHVEMRRDLPTP
jgi:predicted GNAT family N-acyltransferase